MKNHFLARFAAIVCALCATGGVMSSVGSARAEETDTSEASYEALVILDSATDEVDEPAEEITDNRSEIPFYVNGEERGVCPIVDGVPYMSVVSFCRGLELSIDSSFLNNVLNISGDIVSFTAAAGEKYFSCNGRYFYVADGVKTRDGEIILPLETLAECLGVTASWDRVQWLVSVEADVVSPLENGDTYYDETDVYWLSRVIYAEAGNQSLEGQIAVGNVVLNRVASGSFGDSVYDVIFAKNQFDVVINGMVYMEPSDTAQVAAKLALEGCDIVSGATYFATYYLGASYQCVAWIGDHCFMAAA